MDASTSVVYTKKSWQHAWSDLTSGASNPDIRNEDKTHISMKKQILSGYDIFSL
jgi:hypothetical protein